MRNRIRRAVMIALHITMVTAAGACLPPLAHTACGGQWCPEGYSCTSDTLTCLKSGCGNGLVEADEECDDGNLDDEDDCLSTCNLNTCGDGKVHRGVEECDDGNGENGDGCDSNCTRMACGNGAMTIGEQCDDGDAVDFDGCRNDCSVSLLAYIKASNTDAGDELGTRVALSADGSTLAVSAIGESSATTRIGGNQADNSADLAGAVYVFTRSGATWTQQAYIKAFNTDALDQFGSSIALSADGATLAVGATGESSAATGIAGEADRSADFAGAVYVFMRSGTTWTQQAFIQAPNTDAGDQFGVSVALSADGLILAVGAPFESSAATGIAGNQADNSAESAGAVYVFKRSGTRWIQQAYIKASNTDAGDQFGASVALSGYGSTLAVGAPFESSAATGIGGDQTNNSAGNAGAVYMFTSSGTTWIQQAYIKASNTHALDHFGASVALSTEGSTLAVGAFGEASAAQNDGGSQSDTSAGGAGAVYMFTRGATWTQQAYIKAPNADALDQFGTSVALSADGSTLAVGAPFESSAATGIGSNQADNSAAHAGAVYVFTRADTARVQQAYIKAPNTDALDRFGASVALSADGSTLAVGAVGEDNSATGIGGNQADNSDDNAGAAYVFY